MDISRLSVNQITTNNWGFVDAIRNYSSFGIKNIGVWVDKIRDFKPSEVKNILDDHGMKAFNLCSGGLFTDDTQPKRDSAIDHTKKTLELAKEINAGFLLIISGPTLPKRLEESRGYVKKALEMLVPFAEDLDAKMALEAIQPIDISRWSVVVTLGQALGIVREFSSSSLGILLDLYNSWWEPEINELIEQMGGDLLGVHVADWNAETLGVDKRLVPGKGVIPLDILIRKVESSGYTGCFEVEIFNEEIWSGNYKDTLRDIVDWFNGLKVNK